MKCPFCENDNIALFTISKDYQNPESNAEYKAYKCPACNIVFQYPFPSKTNFDDIYPDNYYAHTENQKLPFLMRLLNDMLQEKKRGILFSPVKKSVYPYYDIIKNANKILDIGCGKGVFLDVLKNNKKETYALEPDRNAVKILEKNGHKYIGNDITTCNYENNYFDLVTSFQMIEHIDNPQTLLHEVYKMLKPGGYLIIETPNIKSHQASFKNKWINLDLPRHLILHSPESLVNLLSKEGFKAEALVRVSPSDIKHTFFINRNIKSPLLRKLSSIVLLPYILFQSLFRAKKGSLLITIARK